MTESALAASFLTCSADQPANHERNTKGQRHFPVDVKVSADSCQQSTCGGHCHHHEGGG